jgi:hypothetical protein
VLEQRLIVGVRKLESVDDRSDGSGFGCAKASVLQIQIVNDARQSRDRGLGDAEDTTQRLKRAAFAVVTLVTAVSVYKGAALELTYRTHGQWL